MSVEEQNVELVRRNYAAISRGDLEGQLECIAENWVNHDPNLPPFAGHEGYRQLTAMVAGLGDLRLTIEDIFAAGDRVAVRAIGQGMHTALLFGVPPTGKQLTIQQTAIHRVVDGKITDNWVQFDALGLMQQLGAIPAPPQPVGAAG